MTCQRCGGHMLGYAAIGAWDTDERACLNCGGVEYAGGFTQSDGVADRNAQPARYDVIGIGLSRRRMPA